MRGSTVFLVLMVIGSSHQTLYSCDPSASCGCSRNSASVNRIVGGEDAGNGTWGWVVIILLEGLGGCGGSILSSSWILTAAHCVHPVNLSQISVYAGATSGPMTIQARRVSKAIMHPDYDTETVANDIALLQLSTPLSMTDSSVNVACLPSVSETTLTAGEWPSANTSVSTNLYLCLSA